MCFKNSVTVLEIADLRLHMRGNKTVHILKRCCSTPPRYSLQSVLLSMFYVAIVHVYVTRSYTMIMLVSIVIIYLPEV